MAEQLNEKMDKNKKDKKPEKVSQDKKVKTKRFVLKKFLLHASIGGYSAGSEISLECHIKGGQPKERYWRRRLYDAQKDNCIELLA